MADSIALGYAPLPLVVTLSRDADFVSVLVASAPWPTGTDIALEFRASPAGTPTTWTATIEDERATWDVPAADVLAVLDADKVLARLRYTEADSTVLTWARGLVAVDG